MENTNFIFSYSITLDEFKNIFSKPNISTIEDLLDEAKDVLDRYFSQYYIWVDCTYRSSEVVIDITIDTSCIGETGDVMIGECQRRITKKFKKIGITNYTCL